MTQAIIGAGPRRIDGRRKVSGEAMYASDHHLKNMAYGYGVFSTIASGKITGLDLDAARKSPGVLDSHPLMKSSTQTQTQEPTS